MNILSAVSRGHAPLLSGGQGLAFEELPQRSQLLFSFRGHSRPQVRYSDRWGMSIVFFKSTNLLNLSFQQTSNEAFPPLLSPMFRNKKTLDIYQNINSHLVLLPLLIKKKRWITQFKLSCRFPFPVSILLCMKIQESLGHQGNIMCLFLALQPPQWLMCFHVFPLPLRHFFFALFAGEALRTPRSLFVCTLEPSRLSLLRTCAQLRVTASGLRVCCLCGNAVGIDPLPSPFTENEDSEWRGTKAFMN